MDVRYINPFLSGVIEVLGTMANVSLTAGKPAMKKDSHAMGDVSGIIGLAGQARGSLSVSFGFGVIRAALKNMFGDDITEINAEVRDAVGEITNMVSGVARRLLSEDGLDLQAGIPSVVSGPGHVIKHIVNGPVLVVPFTCEHGQVIIEVAME